MTKHDVRWCARALVCCWGLGMIAQGALGQEGERPDFTIGLGDVVRISVWKDPELSGSFQVRPDGWISYPLIGDLQVVGRTTEDLRQSVTEALKEFIAAPAVTVIVEEINSRRFFVTGQVASPGVFTLLQRTTLMQAIAMAGGVTEFADKDKIVVLRQNGERLQLSVKRIISGQRPEDNLALEPGDTIVVP